MHFLAFFKMTDLTIKEPVRFFFFGFTSGGNIGADLKLYGLLCTDGWASPAGSAGSFLLAQNWISNHMALVLV